VSDSARRFNVAYTRCLTYCQTLQGVTNVPMLMTCHGSVRLLFAVRQKTQLSAEHIIQHSSCIWQHSDRWDKRLVFSKNVETIDVSGHGLSREYYSYFSCVFSVRSIILV